MTCVPSNPRFRLLDWLVGWDVDGATEGLVGEADDGGVRLHSNSSDIDAGAIDSFIPPPRLSPGCNPCEWFLVTQPAPKSKLLRLDGCSNEWTIWPRPCSPVDLQRAVAVAVDKQMLAVADSETNTVWVLHMPGGQVAAQIDVPEPVDLSFNGQGELVVAANGGLTLMRFAINGRSLGAWPSAVPNARIKRVAHNQSGRLWLAVASGAERFALWSQYTICDPSFIERDLETLTAAFNRTEASGSNQFGFCLQRSFNNNTINAVCWSWFGRSITTDCVETTASQIFNQQGQLLTSAIDSGITRCIWHRIQVDAQVPPGTRIEVAVATSDDAQIAEQPGNNAAPWDGFRQGRPHPQDWQIIGNGITDALVTAPAGRYLFVRLRLSGDGQQTPRINSIRLDFPRSTSANLLPAVYLDDPHSQDFLDRFLAVFDANLQTIDQSVARFPALLNSANARSEVLPWIARFLSIALDENWDVATRRQMLANAPELFRQRGTRRGLVRSIQLAFGLDPVITEHGLQRNWGALPTVDHEGGRLGAMRLFSRRAARMKLGASVLGETPIKSYGNPDNDPYSVGAFRFTVSLPITAEDAGFGLRRLVDGQKPAHTIANIAIANIKRGLRLGRGTFLGTGTALVRPAPLALGDSELRLSTGIALGGHQPSLPVLGLSSHIGAATISIQHNNNTCCCSEIAHETN